MTLIFFHQIESRVGFAVRKKLGIDIGNYMTREAQIEKIEKTFEDAKIEITEHHTKKNVYPEYVMPIRPDDQVRAHHMFSRIL